MSRWNVSFDAGDYASSGEDTVTITASVRALAVLDSVLPIVTDRAAWDATDADYEAIASELATLYAELWS